MRYFNFDRLIDKYSANFTLITETKGGYDELGDWTAGDLKTEDKYGAIIGVSESKVYRSDAVLTAKDKMLFTKESLGDITKAHVIYEGNKYSIEQNPNDNHTFTGTWQYTLKWVSVFEGGEGRA